MKLITTCPECTLPCLADNCVNVCYVCMDESNKKRKINVQADKEEDRKLELFKQMFGRSLK